MGTYYAKFTFTARDSCSFISCPYLSFGQNVLYFIVGNVDKNIALMWKDVLLGIIVHWVL